MPPPHVSPFFKAETLWKIRVRPRATPSVPAADAAMSRARRRSRAPEGRTERHSRRGHHPAHGAGKVRADAPRDTRRTGYSPITKTLSALSQKRGVRGCRGCRGAAAPLTPCPAPGRRPAARAGQQPQDNVRKTEKKQPSSKAKRTGKARWGKDGGLGGKETPLARQPRPKAAAGRAR